MPVERYLPSEPLRPYLQHFLLIESPVAATNYVLPDTSLVLALQYRGQVSQLGSSSSQPIPAAALTGLQRTARRLAYAPHTATLLVIFRALGAAVFFREPLHLLLGQSVALESLLPAAAVQQLLERVALAPTHQHRVMLVEQYLLTRLRPTPADALVRQTLHMIQAAHGNLTVRGLLAELPLNRDPLEKRFRSLVGTSPKQWAAIVRLRHVLASAPTSPLTQTALAAGYFDQAHFNKDFRAFTGQAPKAFLASAVYW